MALFQHPLGTVVNLRPEWDWASMAFGGCNTTDVPSNGSNVALFNNDPTGASLFVYLLSLSSTNFGFMNVFYLQGAGTQLVGAPFAVASDGATPSGLIYAENAALPTPLSSFAIIGQSDSKVIAPGWPVAIVRPNTRLCVQSDVGADELSVGFYYRVGKV